MKCKKCGFNNIEGTAFCESCGTITKEKNNKTLFLILGIFLFVILLICLILFIVNKNNTFEDPFDDVDKIALNEPKISTNEYEETNLLVNTLETAYKENQITADEYIMQLAYSIYDRSKLDSKYKELDVDFNTPQELFDKATKMSDKLSKETALYLLKKYTLSDVKWNVGDANTKVSGLNNNLNSTINPTPLVTEAADLSKLSNVVLSSNSNFLIYYSKTGKNKTTDADINKIAKFLEEMVVTYKTKYGLDYKYKAEYDAGSSSVLNPDNLLTSRGKARQLLKNNGIDVSYMDTAMPIYIIDTDAENTNALGYYVKPFSTITQLTLKAVDLTDDLGIQIDNILTTYAFPFFVVSSSLDDFDNSKIVLAHELFHHYQKYICGNGSYAECASNNFTIETNANLAATESSGVNKINTAIGVHAKLYISDVSSSIDKVGSSYGDSALGYGAFVFAENYANIVTNGTNNLFNSMKTTDTLKYLYDNSNGKYKDVLLTTAEKNLTLDYTNKLLLAKVKDITYYPKNYIDLGTIDNKQKANISYSSMQYFYINPENYGKSSQIKFSGNSDDLTILLFVNEKGTYKYLDKQSLNKDFVINPSEFGYYKEVVFAVVNTNVVDNIDYTADVETKGSMTPTVTASQFNLISLDKVIKKSSTIICQQVQESDTWNEIYQMKLDFDSKSKISDMYFKGTIKIKDYNKNNPAFVIAQKIVSKLLDTMITSYKEKFKYVKVITYESPNKYSVTFKLLKNYYEALKGSFNINSEDKLDIITSIKSQGFTCIYK